MNKISFIIKEAQKILSCPICKRKYGFFEIELKGFLDGIYILQTNCENEHTPVMMTIIVNDNQASQVMNDHLATSKSNDKINKGITKEDLFRLDQALADFDGDFQRVYGND